MISTSQHPFGSNAYHVEQLEKQRAEHAILAKKREQILSGCPLWLQVCLEALWNCTDHGTANAHHVDAALDAAELVSKHAAGLSGSGLGDTGSELAIARHVVQAIATSKPAGYKLRVRAARLLCESAL